MTPAAAMTLLDDVIAVIPDPHDADKTPMAPGNR